MSARALMPAASPAPPPQCVRLFRVMQTSSQRTAPLSPRGVDVAVPAVVRPPPRINLESGISETPLREFLEANAWPPGLQDTLIANLAKFPLRYYLCDDSASMSIVDGVKITPDGEKGLMKFSACSRWAEMTEMLRFHIKLAKAASAPCEFRMLNFGNPIRIGTRDEYDDAVSKLEEVFETIPTGRATNLCQHLDEIRDLIKLMEAKLRANRQRVCVIIVTDGMCTDGDVSASLAALQHLPVWIVIRLCTDETKTSDYWKAIDETLESDMDVVDDLCGEAVEVFNHNSWMTYAEPIHRLREFGISISEFDKLDEAPLTSDQIRNMCTMIFGGTQEDFPHPDVDWGGFIRKVTFANKELPAVWSPALVKLRPWIDLAQLKSVLGHGCCCSIS